jgi:plastocyanin
MKRTTTLLASILLVIGGFATDHVISTVGLTYSPAELDVEVGDNVTIQAAPNHPTVQVSQLTWDADGTTPLDGGFGPETSSFTFEITEVGDIYYVCTAHVQLGMKGVIRVGTTGIDELSNSISVNLGRLPITDGRLDYSIEAPEGFVQSIELYSISGSMLVNEPVSSSQGSLQLNARPGVYILLMKDRNGKAVFREQVTVR